ncbi:MAG: TRAP transporter substrate-binding protein DctP, partial [Burkholderiaceae bacterium]
MKKLLMTILVAAAATGAMAQEKTLKFAFQNQKDHPQAQGAQRFADLVAQKSGGKLKVNLYPGGVLGGDLQTVSALQGGTVEITVLNAGILTAQAKEFAVFDFPFLFASPQEADAVTDGPFGTAMFARLADKGLVGLGWWDLGFRNLTNSRRPVTKVEDI